MSSCTKFVHFRGLQVNPGKAAEDRSYLTKPILYMYGTRSTDTNIQRSNILGHESDINPSSPPSLYRIHHRLRAVPMTHASNTHILLCMSNSRILNAYLHGSVLTEQTAVFRSFIIAGKEIT